LQLKIINKSDKTSSIGKKHHRVEKFKNGVILERKEEDYASVFASNRRTVDLVKQKMQLGGVAQKAKRQEKLKQTQNLQTMLSNLYQ